MGGYMLLLADSVVAIPSWLAPAAFGVAATALTAFLSRLVKGYDERMDRLESALETERRTRQDRDHELANELTKYNLQFTDLKARFQAHTDRE